jgi:hypothetical protein
MLEGAVTKYLTSDDAKLEAVGDARTKAEQYIQNVLHRT